MSRARSNPKCAQADGELASHVCLAEGHGLLTLCRRHANAHAKRPRHLVVPFERLAEFVASARRRARRPRES